MNKLEELEKSLKDYKALLEKTMDAMGAEPVATDMNQASMDKKEKDHKDEKEDKEIIAEALDQHNEKKHGEDKDEDSAKKDMKVKKADEAEMVVKFDANGQWSMEKADEFKVNDAAKFKVNPSSGTGKVMDQGKKNGPVKVYDKDSKEVKDANNKK